MRGTRRSWSASRRGQRITCSSLSPRRWCSASGSMCGGGSSSNSFLPCPLQLSVLHRCSACQLWVMPVNVCDCVRSQPTLCHLLFCIPPCCLNRILIARLDSHSWLRHGPATWHCALLCSELVAGSCVASSKPCMCRRSRQERVKSFHSDPDPLQLSSRNRRSNVRLLPGKLMRGCLMHLRLLKHRSVFSQTPSK